MTGFTFFRVLESLLASFSELTQGFPKKTLGITVKRTCFDERETAEFVLLCQTDSVVRH